MILKTILNPLSFARSSFNFKPASKFLAFQSVLIEQMKYSRVISHNVKSIRRDFETRKCGSTFWVSKSCLQAELLLASPVTECRAQNLHYSLASFVTGTKALDLHEFNKILQSVANTTMPAWSKEVNSFRYSSPPQWILAVMCPCCDRKYEKAQLLRILFLQITLYKLTFTPV